MFPLYSCLHYIRHVTFDSEIKSQCCECYISVNSAWNNVKKNLTYSPKNKLVHHNKKCAEISLQKNSLSKGYLFAGSFQHISYYGALAYFLGSMSIFFTLFCAELKEISHSQHWDFISESNVTCLT